MSTPPDDLKAFTDALANVPPHPGRLDRDALLFAAGRAAGRWRVFWPATAAALAGLAATLAVLLLTRAPTVVEVEKVVYVRVPVPTEAAPRPEPDDVPATTPSGPSQELAEGLRLRQRVLSDGVGALPQSPPGQFVEPNVTDLSSLRLNASRPDGGPLQ